MKKLFLICIIILSTTIGTLAQQQSEQAVAKSNVTKQMSASRHLHTPENIAQRKAQFMRKNLGLNDLQYKQSYEAELEFAKVIMPVKKGATPGSAAPNKALRDAAIQKATTTRDNKYKAFLEPEQLGNYEGIKMKTFAPDANMGESSPEK